MKGRLCGFLMVMVYITRVISRPLGPNDVVLPPQQGTTNPQMMSFQFKMASKQDEDMMMKKNEDGIENRIGSRPPSCDHKCYGCSPCEATQVPTTSHVGIQYTNYEPEGWKCKCGPTFYSP